VVGNTTKSTVPEIPNPPREVEVSDRPLVVLFDVDGTLVDTGGAGARSWRRAFDAIYRIPADIGKFTSSGETDPFVARKTFEAVLGRTPSRDELGRLFGEYLWHLHDEVLRSPGYRVLEGVVETLSMLGRASVTLGLVSGAMEGAARTKLIRGNLNRYFVFGGYGSDSDDRAQLTQAAIRRASSMHGRVPESSRVFVVGDTPSDVAAARQVGAVAVGVATGKFSVDELRRAGADHVLASLRAPFPGLSQPEKDARSGDAPGDRA
jgi:phosphoglycolate phosphatase